MSQWDRLLKKIHTLSPEIRFAECKRILEHYGYVMKSPRGGSSHCTFRKAGKPPITIPRHEPIKRIYVQMVKDIFESEDSKP